MSISDLCVTMNLNYTTAQKRTLGLIIAPLYREKYPGCIIGVHDEMVGGHKCQVKHYVQKDHSWIQDVIRANAPSK